MPDKINIENLKLNKYHCIECGVRLCDFNLLTGKLVLEVKCGKCNCYNLIYIEAGEAGQDTRIIIKKNI